MNAGHPWWPVIAAVLAIAQGGASALAQDAPADFDISAPIEIVAESLEFSQDLRQATATGNVVATQGQIMLSADRLIVHFRAGDGSGPQSVSIIDALGNVFFSTTQETAEGDAGTYDVEKGMITLTGGVVLTRGANVLRGSRLVLNLVDGTSKVEGAPGEDGGRVRGLFVPANPGN